MKKLCFLLLATVCCLATFGQTDIAVKNLSVGSDGWIKLQESASFIISVKSQNCNGVTSFLLKLENKSNEDITIKWHHRKTGEAAPASEAMQSIMVDKNTTKEGVCPPADQMTIKQSLVTYLYDGVNLQDLVFTLQIN